MRLELCVLLTFLERLGCVTIVNSIVASWGVANVVHFLSLPQAWARRIILGNAPKNPKIDRDAVLDFLKVLYYLLQALHTDFDRGGMCDNLVSIIL